MTFAGFVWRNLLRQRVRAGLTMVGISLGITTIVALGLITSGLKGTASSFIQSGGADFMVAQRGAADLSFSAIQEDRLAEIAAVEGVASARGMMLHVTRAGSNPLFFLGGVELDEAGLALLPELTAGRYPTPDSVDEVAIGGRASADLGAGVGDAVSIGDVDFTVVGVFASEVLWEDAGGVAPLARVQEIANAPRQVTVVHVVMDPGAQASEVAARIEEAVPVVVAILTADDYGQVDSGFQIIDAANIGISILAILIGGVGVMNTMVMSVFERTREIGVLRAVGWSGPRVVRMIVIEALFLCVGGALVGLGAGLLAAEGVSRVPAVQGFLDPRFQPGVLVQALIVAVVVALAGAAYPAFRAVRLTPMEALRYE